MVLGLRGCAQTYLIVSFDPHMAAKRNNVKTLSNQIPPAMCALTKKRNRIEQSMVGFAIGYPFTRLLKQTSDQLRMNGSRPPLIFLICYIVQQVFIIYNSEYRHNFVAAIA